MLETDSIDKTVMLYSRFKNSHQSATDLVINIVPTSVWFFIKHEILGQQYWMKFSAL